MIRGVRARSCVTRRDDLPDLAAVQQTGRSVSDGFGCDSTIGKVDQYVDEPAVKDNAAAPSLTVP
jgi:hypothetical protein